jgi:choice-of-anchor C domain-containing protein
MKKPFLLGVMVLMVIGLVWMSSPPVAESQAARPNLVRNGSFETPNVAPEGEIFSAGSTIGAWAVRTGSVQLLGNAFQARAGDQALDLSGNTRGSVSQDLKTVPGSFYRIKFFLAGNVDGPPRIKKVRVFWGTRNVGTFSFDTFEKTRALMGFEDVELRVRATDAKTRLKFVGLTTTDFGPVIDAVSVRVDN